MRDLLDRLNRWISLHRSDLVARLAPGIEIAPELGDIPDAARDWFRWSDGLRGEGPGLVLGWRPLGWEASRAAAALAARDPYALEGDWHPGWLPFAASERGDLLVLDTDGVLGEPDAVVEVVRGASTRVRHAPSLAVWLDALVETLEDDCWAPDADGVWSPTPDSGDLWNTLVLDPEGYPIRVDPRWEEIRLPPRPLDWREAYAHALGESALEAVWLGATRGDVALGHLLGDSLDTALARIDAAPMERRPGRALRGSRPSSAQGRIHARERSSNGGSRARRPSTRSRRSRRWTSPTPRCATRWSRAPRRGCAPASPGAWRGLCASRRRLRPSTFPRPRRCEAGTAACAAVAWASPRRRSSSRGSRRGPIPWPRRRASTA